MMGGLLHLVYGQGDWAGEAPARPVSWYLHMLLMHNTIHNVTQQLRNKANEF